MNKIILSSLVSVGFLVAMPLMVNALDSQIVSQSFDDEVKVRISQVRPPYQIGYTVHYRSPRDRKWTLEGFHVERRNAERAARRLQRSGFRTKIRSLAAAERRRSGGR
jgi:phage replication-related protein YjqB (UPF0714/DUF867 family)